MTLRERVEKIHFEEISQILLTSEAKPHAFLNPNFVNNLSANNADWWIAFKGKEPFCFWPIFSSNKRGYLPNFTYWVGPFWLKKIRNSSRLIIQNRFYDLFFEKFKSNYEYIVFEMQTTDLDVRFFDWYGNYEKKAKIKIEPRYSANISLESDKNDGHFLNNFSELRRREIKKYNSNQELFIFDEKIPSFDEILILYRRTLSRNSTSVDNKTIQELSRIMSCLNTQNSFSKGYRLGTNHNLVGVGISLIDENQANLLLNLVDDNFRNYGIMTNIVYQILKECKNKDIKLFDFNGANSPNRARDKHSYGATESLYFRISVDWRHG